MVDAIQRVQSFEQLHEGFAHHLGPVLLHIPFPQVQAMGGDGDVIGQQQVRILRFLKEGDKRLRAIIVDELDIAGFVSV